MQPNINSTIATSVGKKNCSINIYNKGKLIAYNESICVFFISVPPQHNVVRNIYRCMLYMHV